MEITTQFSLEKHDGPYEKWPLTSRLFVNGEDTRTKLPGFVIECAYTCSVGYLIITSWDCPYEEFNNFTLLNHAFESVAKTALGAMYDTYLLDAHMPISDHALGLTYYRDLHYTLSIEAGFSGRKPKLTLQEVDFIPTAFAAFQTQTDRPSTR